MAYKVRKNATYNLNTASTTIELDGSAEIFTFSNDGSNDITITLKWNPVGGEEVVNEFVFKAGEQYNFNEVIYKNHGFTKIEVSQSTADNFRLWIIDEVK